MVGSDEGENEIAPFRNILNEMVARDTSKKVKSAMRVKFNNGEYIAPAPPIGYIIDPNQKNKLIVDEETAWIPKKIFELAAHGKGAGGIARQLTAEKVPTPYWYRYLRRGERASKFENQPEDVRWQWSLVSVRGILDNEIYIGNTVHYKCQKVSFKSKKNRKTSEDEWLWVDLISKYSEINELTAPLLNELIDKIVVHEKRIDADGKPTRDIEIYYRFVGRID